MPGGALGRAGIAATAIITPTTTPTPAAVAAIVETTPVTHTGDAADDMAIWIHPIDPALSTIVGTDKKGGLMVYDLAGNLLQYRPDGEMNNVDLRHSFGLGGRAVALVTAGDRTTNSIAIYQVDPTTRLLEPVGAQPVTNLEIYGSCMYRSLHTGRYYVFVNSKSGQVEQWELLDLGGGQVGAQLVRSFAVSSTVEGCVADDELGYFYLGEESVGIWKYGAEPNDGPAGTLIAATARSGPLVSNVEGLTIYYASDRTGYLIASSQGSSTFVIYRREGANAYVGTFAIVAGNGIDAVSGTDGIDVTNFGLGSVFPQGVFVAQDGINDVGNQNFKLVPWPAIAQAGGPPLTIDPAWDPRLGDVAPSPTPTATATAMPSPTPGEPKNRVYLPAIISGAVSD
jgi:3-phytase